jgi:hypothetical protein
VARGNSFGCGRMGWVGWDFFIRKVQDELNWYDDRLDCRVGPASSHRSLTSGMEGADLEDARPQPPSPTFLPFLPPFPSKTGGLG